MYRKFYKFKMLALKRTLRKDFYMFIVFGIVVIIYLLIHSYYYSTPDNNIQDWRLKEHRSKPSSGKKIIYQKPYITDCGSVNVTKDDFLKEGWQKVDKYSTVFVYSAYVSWAGDTQVIIIATVKTYETMENGVVVIYQATDDETFYCRFWYLEHLSSGIVEAETINSPLVEKKKSRVAVFKCPLPSDSIINLPEAVSVVQEDRCITPQNYLPIHPPIKQSENINFTVCVPPLTFSVHHETTLIEWIELNNLLGADLFVLYYQPSSDARNALDNVLQLYSERGLVKVINWNKENLPFEVDQDGKVAAINDCYHRHKHKSTYIVVLDINEYIIPKNPYTFSWGEMMLQIPSMRKGAFVFHVSYFNTDWPDASATDNITNLGNAKNYGLKTLLKINRENRMSPPSLEAKYISQSYRVKILGSTNILEMNPDYSSTLVHPDIAFVHKYAAGIRRDISIIKDDSIPVKYGDKLVERMRESWKGRIANKV